MTTINKRTRSNSITNELEYIQTNSKLNSSQQQQQQLSATSSSSTSTTTTTTSNGKTIIKPKIIASTLLKEVTPSTFLQDIKSFRWMTNPLTSFKMISIILTLYMFFELIPTTSFYSFTSNPLNPFLFISYPLSSSSSSSADSTARWDKGLQDIKFLLFYIIVFSFIRQGLTEFLIRPLARRLGLRNEGKQLRFMEQAYAIIYNSISGGVGLWIMYNGDTWWYKTEHFWLEYPHWRMTTLMKSYYLLQMAYWLQQMIVLSLRLEKPRSDYYQLIIHHIVTIWLVVWSYSTSLNMIGVAIFVSMDIPEIFLGSSKCLNYVNAQRASEVAFVFLLGFWTYMRHYLNLKILYSVWYEFDLIPLLARSWTSPSTSWSLKEIGNYWILSGVGKGSVPDWIRYQIFIPIFLLQLVNGFWSFLLWRICFRLIMGIELRDDREDGDDDLSDVEEVSDGKVNEKEKKEEKKMK